MVADLLAVRPETVPTPREAFFAVEESVPLAQASGRTAAEAITPYPPGIPLVMPGERLSADVLDLLTALDRFRELLVKLPIDGAISDLA